MKKTQIRNQHKDLVDTVIDDAKTFAESIETRIKTELMEEFKPRVKEIVKAELNSENKMDYDEDEEMDLDIEEDVDIDIEDDDDEDEEEIEEVIDLEEEDEMDYDEDEEDVDLEMEEEVEDEMDYEEDIEEDVDIDIEDDDDEDEEEIEEVIDLEEEDEMDYDEDEEEDYEIEEDVDIDIEDDDDEDEEDIDLEEGTHDSDYQSDKNYDDKLATENKKLKHENKRLRTSLKRLTHALNNAAVLNEQLTAVQRLFKIYPNMDIKTKESIVEQISKADTLESIKLVSESLRKVMSSLKRNTKKRTHGSSSKREKVHSLNSIKSLMNESIEIEQPNEKNAIQITEELKNHWAKLANIAPKK